MTKSFDQDALVGRLPFRNLDSAVKAALEIIDAGEEITLESFEGLADRAGSGFIPALNKALAERKKQNGQEAKAAS